MLPNHDQDRIKNIQASDLYVEKVWEELPTNIQEIYVKLYRSRGTDGQKEDVTKDIAKRTETYSGYGFVENPDCLMTTVQDGVLVIKPDTDVIHLHGLPLVYDDDNYVSKPYYYWIEEVGYKDTKGNIYTDTAKFNPQYDRWDASTNTWSDWTSNGKDAATSLGQVSRNRIRANNAPTSVFKVQKEWIDETGTKLTAPWDSNISSISFSVKRVAQKYTRNSTEDEWIAAGEPEEAELTFDSGSVTGNTITVTSPGHRAQVAVKQSGGTEYSINYMSDADDPEDIGAWATIVDGLQKSHKVSDTELWRYAYKIGKEYTITKCNTTFSNTGEITEGETVTITNEKIGTSLAIEKTFSGGVTLTDAQKQKITFTVTGKFDGTNETSKTFTYGVDSDGCSWNNGVLVIRDIHPGIYSVTEQNDGIDSIFTGDTSEVTYTHTSTCTVTNGTVTDGTASAMVAEGDRTTVRFVNTYNEGPTTISVTLKKVDKKNVNKTPLEASDLLDGAQFVIEKYTRLTPVESKDKEWNDAHKELNAGNEGVFTFTDLPVGIYKIVEKEYPNGYVHVTTDPIFEVVVDEDTGELRVQIKNDSNGLVRLDDKNELIIIVGNEPGVALPNTGGPGTRLFTILGSILILGAGVLLWRRRRTI
jgi:LPXTG-motif cell wall-anchored protein